MPESLPFATRERHALCDLVLALSQTQGEDTATLCGGWNIKDLVVHLLVRERSLIGAPGIVLSPFAGLTEQVSAKMARADLALLVSQLRQPRLTWAAIGPLDAALNSAEFFVHHEDVRRARPDWVRRELAAADEQRLWRHLGLLGRRLTRPAAKLPTPIPLRILDTSTGAERQLVAGPEPVTLEGLPSELLLSCYGRPAAITYAGPQDAIERLKQLRFSA